MLRRIIKKTFVSVYTGLYILIGCFLVGAGYYVNLAGAKMLQKIVALL